MREDIENVHPLYGWLMPERDGKTEWEIDMSWLYFFLMSFNFQCSTLSASEKILKKYMGEGGRDLSLEVAFVKDTSGHNFYFLGSWTPSAFDEAHLYT